ncbi:SANT/Myb domain [Dillenia turbinata]|uniref:SANT/Myb domain n=1 Tax=Dillenia turbinata TaxID=194707 RepID=A0AAN8ZB78_9MAGN
MLLIYQWYFIVMTSYESINGSCSWRREEDKAFENALATISEDSLDRWERIAQNVPGKSIEEVKHHYDVLVDDVNRIESGCVPLPTYHFPSEGSFGDGHVGESGTSRKVVCVSGNGGKGSRSDQDRRKGVAWTEEEHRLFLLGLDKYGKGDWRSISRNLVVTRTPTQVASHAQKYFIRLNSMNKERRRSSIHDITNVSSRDISMPQVQIAGQPNAAISGSPNPPAAPLYGAMTIGQSMDGAIVPNLAAPPPMAYGVEAPVQVQMDPGVFSW